MVSIGVSLVLFSLIPLILCTNEGFLKISDTENEKRQLECGHLSKFVEGTSTVLQKPVGSWISPYHFITSITSVSNNKNYNDLECETRGHMVTSFYEPKAKFAAKVVGKCNKEGVVLVDTHAEYDKPHKKFFCLKEKTPKTGDLVDVVNDKGVEEPGTVVDCPDPKKKSVFCVATKKANKHGHVFSGDKENYSLIGVTLGHIEKNKMILEVFSLAEHHDEICQTTGVCNTKPSKRLPVPPPTLPPVVKKTTVPMTNTTVATEITTSSEDSSSTNTPSTKPAEKTTTSEDVAEVTTTVIAKKEEPTTKTENKTDAATTESAGESTEDPIQDPTTQKPKDPSTKPPVVPSTSSEAPTSEPEPVATIPDTPQSTASSPGSQPTSPPASSVTTASAPVATDSKQHPHAEALTDFSDIDCEKENLCFDEDIFASASANGGILLIICVSVVFMGF